MATYYFKDTTSYSSNDPSNWYNDSAFTVPAGTVPNYAIDDVIIGDSTMSVRCNFEGNITVGSGHRITITANANAYVGGDYACILTFSNGSMLDVYGSFYINGDNEVINQGTITIIDGYFSIQAGGDLLNINSIANLGTLVISGNLINDSSAMIQTDAGAQMVNDSNSNLLLSANSTINNYGSFINYTTFNIPSGAYFNNYSGTFTNTNGVVIIRNQFHNTGTFNNAVSVLNVGTFNNSGLGAYINTGTTTNNGIFNNDNTAFFSIKPSSTFTNNNQFIFGTAYNTYFKGRIFPQIPSSAAFGTAVLF